MKGKYINTTILLAARSGRRQPKQQANQELLQHHQLIWQRKTEPSTDFMLRIPTKLLN